MPKVSIIVPCYKVEPFIHRCIDSILSQDFTDFELIAVDDGSPDNCGKILDDYAVKDNRIKVIHRENGGLAAARNSGIEIAKGDYIYSVDSDDYLSSNDFLGRIFHEINDNKADMVVFNWTRVEISGEVKKAFEIPVDAVNGKSVGQGLLALIGCNRFPNSFWSRITRRSIIVDNNIYFDPFYRNCQDVEWNIRIFSFVKKLRALDYPKYMYRVNEKTANSERGQKAWEYRYKIIDTHYLHLLKNKNMDSDLRKALLGFLAYTWYLCIGSVSDIADKKKRAEVYKKLSEYRDIRKYGLSAKTRKAEVIVSLLGIKLSSHILQKYKKRR